MTRQRVVKPKEQLINRNREYMNNCARMGANRADYMSHLQGMGALNVPKSLKGLERNRFIEDLYPCSDPGKATRAFIEHFDETRDDTMNGLYLYGETGTGKTFYASCVFNEMRTRGYRVIMASLPAVIETHMLGNPILLLNDICDADLVIFDDLGTVYDLEKTEQRHRLNIARVYIDQCINAAVPMLITSHHELTLAAYLNSYGVYDRVKEKCLPVEIKIHDDQRDKKQHDNETEKRELYDL